MGRGLVDACVPSNRTLEPKLYSNYPPVFPLVFGSFVRVFGAGAYQNTFFNLAVAALGCGVWGVLLHRVFPLASKSFGGRLMTILLALMIPTGTLTTATDRPDSLAFLIFVLSFLMCTGHDSQKRIAFAFFLAGLNATVSPFAGIVNFVCLCAARWPQLAAARRFSLVCLLLSGLAPVATIACCSLADPDAIGRLWAHGAGRGGLGKSIVSGSGFEDYSAALRHAATSSGIHSASLFFGSLAILLLLCGYAAKRAHTNRTSVVRFLLGAGGLGLFTFTIFPVQNNYMGFVRNAIFVLFLVLLPGASKDIRSDLKISTVAMILLALAQVPEMARDITGRLVSRGSYARALAQAAALADELRVASPRATPPAGAVSTALYFVFKPHFDVYDLTSFPFESGHDRIQFAAAGFVGTGNPFRSAVSPWIQEHGWKVISEPHLPQVPRIGRIALSRSSITWESRIYREPVARKMSFEHEH